MVLCISYALLPVVMVEQEGQEEERESLGGVISGVQFVLRVIVEGRTR